MEQDLAEIVGRSRRQFLTSSASGLGALALGASLSAEGILSAEPLQSTRTASLDPLTPKSSHFKPRAKACIFIFMEGAPSQADLFDPKPKLNELHGQKLPESLTKNVRFAFLQKDTATVMGSPRRWTRHGQCGMELSE